LAADSRVTLNAQAQVPSIGGAPTVMLLPSTFDNATKLLRVKGQDFVGAVTYGVGAIGVGLQEPRTAHSFIPEFEASLGGAGRLSVRTFAERLSDFFMECWTRAGMPNPVPAGQDLVFLVGGYDEGAPYGTVFELFIPSRPSPRETLLAGQFGATWGGQHEFVSRLINGFDPMAISAVREFLAVPAATQQGVPDPLDGALRLKLSARIPWQFLPLQDCVDLSIFLVRATIALQKWTVGIRGVGGAVDVATITRVNGFEYVQQKTISGEVTK
jgi:hypothetical protein